MGKLMKLTPTTQKILSALVADIPGTQLADRIVVLTGVDPDHEVDLRAVIGLSAQEWLSSYEHEPIAEELIVAAMQMADHMDEETPTVEVDETGTSWASMPLREHLRRAGSSKSDKKAASSRENGKKGGRPKKV